MRLSRVVLLAQRVIMPGLEDLAKLLVMLFEEIEDTQCLFVRIRSEMVRRRRVSILLHRGFHELQLRTRRLLSRALHSPRLGLIVEFQEGRCEHGCVPGPLLDGGRG